MTKWPYLLKLIKITYPYKGKNKLKAKFHWKRNEEYILKPQKKKWKKREYRIWSQQQI
jgi:hypothetical protein